MTDFPSPSLALDATTLLSHSAWLAKFARALVANEADIDDVVQQTLATALARPPRHTGNLRGWLGTVAKNVVRSSARSDTARAAREVALPPPPPVESPVEAVARAELRRKVVECVLALDEPYRSTVILRFFEEQEVRAIARLTQTGEDTVRTRLRRGVLRVRELLERRVDDENRGSAHEGVAARVLLLSRLRDIAASADRPSIAGGGGAHGSSAVSRGFGRNAAVQIPRRVLVGAATVVVATGGWWAWKSADGRSDRKATSVARSDAPAAAPTAPFAPAPAAPVVVADRSSEDSGKSAPPPTPPAPAPQRADRGTLRGVVTAPDGTPVAGAYVWALKSPTHEAGYLMPEFGKLARGQLEHDPVMRIRGEFVEARSDAAGRYEFRDLPTMPGWAIGAYEPTVGAAATAVFDFDHDHREITADVPLIRGTHVRGTVRDENGSPVGGARVFVFATCNQERWTTVTDANPVGPNVGDFDLGFQCGDPMLYGCGTPTFAGTDRFALKIEPGTKETVLSITIQRRPGVLVRGRIVDPTGDPIDFASLLLRRFASDQPDLRWGRAAIWAVADGATHPPVLVSGMPPPKGFIEGRIDVAASRYEVVVPENFRGKVELRIFKALWVAADLDDPHAPPDLESDEDRLPKEGVLSKISIRYVDAATKLPIDLGNEAELPALIDDERSAPILRSECDPAQGRVTYQCAPGKCPLDPTIHGYARNRFVVDVPREPRPLPTTVEIAPAVAGVRGVALHADGRPFARAVISVQRATPDGWVDATGTNAVTNDDGEFEFDRLAKGEHAVVVSGQPDEAPGVVRFAAAEAFPRVEVRTSVGRSTHFRILGKQTDRDVPPNPYFRVFDRDGVVLEDLKSHWSRVSKSPVEVTLKLDDGRYAVAVERYGFRETRLDFDVPRESLDVPLEPMDLDWK